MEKKLTNSLKLVSIFTLAISVVTLSFTFNLKNLFDTNTERLFPKEHISFVENNELNKYFAEENKAEYYIFQIQSNKQGDFLSLESIKQTSLFLDSMEKKWGLNTKSYLDIEFAFEKENNIQFGTISEAKLTDQLETNLLSNSIFSPRFISKDKSKLNILIKSEDIKSSHLVFTEDLIALGTTHDYSVSHALSNKLLNEQIQKDLGNEVLQNLIISFFVLVLISLLLYRSFHAAFFHSLLYTANLVFCMAFCSVLGWKLNTLSISLPIILIIMQISLGAHLLGKFNGLSFFAQLKKTWVPISVSLASTFLGFASLSLSDSPYLQDYSKLMCLAILCSSVQFFSFLAWTATHQEKFVLRRYKIFENWVDFQERVLASSSVRSGLLATSLFLVVCLFASYNKLSWDAAPNNLLNTKSTAYSSLIHHRESTKGARTYYISLEGKDASYWEELNRLKQLDIVLKQWKIKNENIHSLTSYADLLRLFDGKGEVPSDSQKIAEAGFLMSMMGTDISPFSSSSKKSLRLQFSTTNANYRQTKASVNQLTDNLKTKFPDVKSNWYSKNKAQFQIRKELSQSLYLSFLYTAGLILLGLFAMWRNFRLVALSLLPNLLPVASLSLFLAASGWSFDPVLAIVFSIVVGISFDNTVFFINSWIKDKSPCPTRMAIRNKNKDSLLSNLSLLLCFSVFLTSSSEINLKFGALMLLSIFTAYFADSFVLPSLLWDSKERDFTKYETLTVVPESDNKEEIYEIAA